MVLRQPISRSIFRGKESWGVVKKKRASHFHWDVLGVYHADPRDHLQRKRQVRSTWGFGGRLDEKAIRCNRLRSRKSSREASEKRSSLISNAAEKNRIGGEARAQEKNRKTPQGMDSRQSFEKPLLCSRVSRKRHSDASEGRYQFLMRSGTRSP